MTEQKIIILIFTAEKSTDIYILNFPVFFLLLVFCAPNQKFSINKIILILNVYISSVLFCASEKITALPLLLNGVKSSNAIAEQS